MTITEDEKKAALAALEKTIDLVDHDSGDPIPTPFKDFLPHGVYETIRKAFNPPPVDGELAKALLWLENTKRHLDEQDRMKEMLYCESLLQAATSQQAREWTVDHETLQNDICSIVSKYGVKDIYSCETEILAAIERAAKNIIKLKRE